MDIDEKTLGIVGSSVAALFAGGWGIMNRYNKSVKASLEAKEGAALFDKKMTEAAGDIVKQLREQNEWLDKQIKTKDADFEKQIKAKDEDISKIKSEYERLKAEIAALKTADLEKLMLENTQLKKDFAELQEKFRKTEQDFTALMKRIVSAESQAYKDVPFTD
jgi:chromosome segregation ATPase